MKEHPILFSGPMVKAILDGRKTQTRRVIKPQPPHWKWNHDQWDERCINVSLNDDNDGYYVICSYGKAGDHLWVRETWDFRDLYPSFDKYLISYGADGEQREVKGVSAWNPIVYNYPRWRPSIHMPRWASRLTLEIVNIRVEHVQEIKTEDVRAEGIVQTQDGYWLAPLAGVPDFPWEWAQPAYASLWNDINDKRGYGWDINPWVWVIEFKMVGEP